MSDGKPDFLARWSRRKQEQRHEPEPVADETPGLDAIDLDAMTDEEVLAHLDLPDPDNLAQGDDFSRFLVKGVPARIVRRAMRRLWSSHPAYAVIDGLDDYCEDFGAAARAAGPVVTSYVVGKGLKAHTDWLKEQAEKLASLDGDPERQPETPPQAPPETPPQTPPEVPPAPPEEAPGLPPAETPPPGPDELPQPKDQAERTKRRMIFRPVEESDA